MRGQAKRIDPDQRTLFVGNLPYDATEEDLREAFERYMAPEYDAAFILTVRSRSIRIVHA